MKMLSVVLCLILASALRGAPFTDSRELSSTERPIADMLKEAVRHDHPRMFFNRDTLPNIRAYLKRPRMQRFYNEQIKKLAEHTSANPPLHRPGDKANGRRPDGSRANLPRAWVYGEEAAACALVWTLEHDRSYFEKSVALLECSGRAALTAFSNGVKAGDYYSQNILYAIAAFDWLYNDLTADQRRALIAPFLEYAWRCRTESHTFVTGDSLPGEGGFYGPRMLKWYAGLAAWNDGLDDPTATKLAVEGYRDLRTMMEARNAMSGDDGGFVSPCNNYTMATYPFTSYNFCLTWESATGKRLPDLRHLEYFPQWCVWNRIAGTPYTHPVTAKRIDTYDFGTGDTANDIKAAEDVSCHMYFLMHLFPEKQAIHRIARMLMTRDPLLGRWPATWHKLDPIFLHRSPDLPETYAPVLPAPAEHARFFEGVGIAFMRSGSTSTDTYACFATGKTNPAHRHFDANHFMLYKHDFLALDTGTRIGWKPSANNHLKNYYAQSVAHNTVLIDLPDEPMPSYWTFDDGTYHSHGGQDKTIGDRCLAFETNKLFTYIAGDAHSVYSARKCREALRQFVFVYPDLFIIADRVVSTRPEYRKTWLLHTENKPEMLNAVTWRADDGGGRLICRTLWPSTPALTRIGGPGREFEASGRNWELPPAALAVKRKGKTHFGQWRMEVSPAKPATETVFLHVIQVGNDRLDNMIPTRRLDEKETFGVEFTYGDKLWEFRFARSHAPAGTIRIARDGKLVLDRALRQDIQPQNALGY